MSYVTKTHNNFPEFHIERKNIISSNLINNNDTCTTKNIVVILDVKH